VVREPEDSSQQDKIINIQENNVEPLYFVLRSDGLPEYDICKYINGYYEGDPDRDLKLDPAL
jgi:hypothetical protein